MQALLMTSLIFGVTSNVPDGSFLQPYTNLWNVTVIVTKTGRHVDAGTWSDDGRFVSYGGHDAFQRTQVFKIKRTGAENTTVNVFDPKSMRPFQRRFFTSGRDSTDITVDGNRVVSKQIDAGKTASAKHTEVAITQPFYDFSGGMYGLLLAGYPLSVGYRNTLTTLAERDLSLQQIPFKVTAREPVEAKPGTQVMAWKVEAIWHEPDPKTDGSKLTFWLTKEPPYIIKLIYDSPGLGQTYIYTMA